MDRRDFLKTSGAAAVATGAAGSSALAAEIEATTSQRAPAIWSGGRPLKLAVDYSRPIGCGPERLMRRIETATDGRYRVELADDAEVHLTYGDAGRSIAWHAAFHVFAGLPFAQGLDASAQHAWLAVGGGGTLWDDVAADFGFKPLLCGHTGASPGVWATARLDQVTDLSRLPVHAIGLAGEALRTLGAVPTASSPDALKAALAGGQIRAAEWLGPVAAVSPDMQPLAQRLYEPGFHRAGMVMSLDVSRRVWESMNASDQAIFEACAAHEYHLSLAEARTQALVAAQVGAPAKWPLRLAFPEAVADAFDLALAEVMEGLAATEPRARRILDSYQAFRSLLGDDIIV